MRDAIRFWGYAPEVYRAAAGAGVARAGERDAAAAVRSAVHTVRVAPRLAERLSPYCGDLSAGVPALIAGLEAAAGAGDADADAEPMVWIDGGPPLVTRRADGQWRVYFDIDATIEHVEQEKYFETRPPLYVRIGIDPDRLPRFVRTAALVAFAVSRNTLRRAARATPFPSVPHDVTVDMWRYLVRLIVEDQCSASDPEPLWPDGKRFAVTLNHDVDTEWGFSNPMGVEAFRRIEEDNGVRSAWMVVGRLFGPGDAVLRSLHDAGHEIGCHGTVHDHAIAYGSVENVRDRLEGIAGALAAFQCTGFRSPSYHHSETLFRGLDGRFSYDMSVHDAFENDNSPVPSFEGCSTCFPYRLAGTQVLEIPTTVEEDFLLGLRGLSPEQALQAQLGSVDHIARRQGVANILTHPEPNLSARPEWIGVYRDLVADVSGRTDAWIALPREIDAWWRGRETRIAERWDGH